MEPLKKALPLDAKIVLSLSNLQLPEVNRRRDFSMNRSLDADTLQKQKWEIQHIYMVNRSIRHSDGK